MDNKEATIHNNNNNSSNLETLSILNMDQELQMVHKLAKEGLLILGHNIVHMVQAEPLVVPEVI